MALLWAGLGALAPMSTGLRVILMPKKIFEVIILCIPRLLYPCLTSIKSLVPLQQHVPDPVAPTGAGEHGINGIKSP